MEISATPAPLSSKPHYHSISGRPCNSPSKSRPLTIVSMAPQKKVNKLDGGWQKKWYGAGIFYEGAEEVEVVRSRNHRDTELGWFSGENKNREEF
ncbi:unnamed protein product [Prunus brigantina]